MIRRIADVITGDEYTFKLSASLGGTPLPGATEVYAVLTDRGTPITSVITGTHNGTNWDVVFPEVETLKLLSDPQDKQSPLKYKKVTLEVEIGGQTWHSDLTVGQGVL
jgi:hypothetical protein